MASGGTSEGDSWKPPGKGAGKPQTDRIGDGDKKGITTQRIELDSDYHRKFLEELRFQDSFLQKNPNFDGKFDYKIENSICYLETFCTNEVKKEIKKSVDEFISSIKPISLESNVQALLFVKDSKCASDLREKLKERNVKCSFIEHNKNIFTKSEYVNKVEEVIDELFSCMTVLPKDPRYFHFTTENFRKFRKSHENKDFKFERRAGIISFAAVKSAVADELLEAMRFYESDQCEYVYTPTQAEAVQKWGPKKKEEHWVFLNKLHSEGRYIYTRKALLLKEKPTEEYIKQKLTTENISALFETESDDCVNLLAFSRDEAAKAEAQLNDSICEVPFCYTDEILKTIHSEEFKKHFGIWNGKFVFDGLESAEKEAEANLFATDDVVKKLQKLVLGNYCPPKNATVGTTAIIHPDLCEKFESETNLKEMGNKYNCKISRKILGPHLANCWLLGDKISDYFRVHLIAGHAESLNVDAVICPCTSVMFPVNDCFGMYRNIMSDKSTAKKHEMNHTEETLAPDEFHCQQIIYMVTCEPNNAQRADLGSIVKDALLKADSLSCKSLAIPLTLQPESIMTKKEQAKEIAVAVRNKPYLSNLEEVFVCECSNYPSYEIEQLWKKLICETVERYIDFKPLQESALRMSVQQKESIHKPAINVKIVIDTLVSQQVDAIVNTCQRDLNLTKGKVSKLILEKGGETIQKELREKNGEGKFGEIAVTTGGNLPCRHIFHGALYKWTPVGDFSLKVLKLMVWNCLIEADKLKCSSIAFPSLGTGNLLHPFHLVAETMYHTIQCYEQCHSDTNIKHISIILYEKDEECIQQFKTVEKMKGNLFQSREECHPPQYLTCRKILASRSVTVDLLPSRSNWKWGSLLRMTFCSRDNGKGLIWDQANFCWNLEVYPSPNWFVSLASSLTSDSYFGKESLVIKYKRITSIELSLSGSTDGYKKQIDNFFKLMDCMIMKNNLFINHVLIVFPSTNEFMKESSNIDGHWKTRGRLDDFPIQYTLTGDPQDISSAKQEIDDIITKMERDLQKRKKGQFKDNGNGSSVDPPLDDFSIFQTVTGVVCLETTEKTKIEVIKTIISDAGCKLEKSNNSLSICIEGNLSQIISANQRLIERRNDSHQMNSAEESVMINTIPMSQKEYQAVTFFGRKHDWFKKIMNKITHTEGSLCFTDLSVEIFKVIEGNIIQLLKSIKMMTSDSVLVKNKAIDHKKAIEELEEKTPNVCLISEGDKIEIISDNYLELLQAKGFLEQRVSGNRRAGRTFAKMEDQEKTNEDKRSFVKSDGMNRSMRSHKVELKTKEGLIIQIYTGSITYLTVDCIVNAANEQLMHGGGVAAAISEAAGYQFDLESRDYVKKYGPIPVGRCCVTSAGKLPYKCVIHTVGPRWSDYTDKNQCLQDLRESVEVTFRVADKNGMKKIAIPAISSGIFAVPRKNCVEEYYKAAMSFSSNNYPFKSLQEIHFVDRDESMVKAIQEIFRQKEVPKSTLEKSENPGKEKEIPADGAENSAQAAIPDPNLYTIVHVSENFQVKIHLGNITDIAADAIVCPQDEYLSTKDDIAVEIFKKLPYAPKSSNEKKFHGDISSQALEENSPWKIIIYAVTPRYDCNYSKDIRKFGAVLKTMVESIIEAADKAKVCSVAIPLLGTGKEDFKTPVELCASNFFKAVMDSQSKVSSLKDIYLVLDNKDVEEMYLGDFKYTCKITPRAVSKVANSKSIRNFGKTLTDLPKNEENCCICMDKLTDPKKLQKCGHLFCKDCIDQYFKYKPACPSCGQIYGKMTGDQPPGSITIRKDYQQRLEGFNDNTGCIILTYAFQSGHQGPEHPEQGKWYKGISRSGYLPNNDTGRLVAKLLNVAFSRRLVFTIGRSRTTGHEGVITWNDIHHKTRPGGGPAQFGYPDPTYLDRVLEELEAKGVTEESADDPEEYKEYSKLFSY